MVLKSVSAHKADDVMGAWRKLHDEEGDRWFVWCAWEMCTNVLFENLKGTTHW
jgi:hypothetical protein